MKVKELSKYARPREKLERYGVQKLVDHELLAIVLGSGIKGTNVVELAKKIVKKIETIGHDNLSLDDLVSIKGLGKIKAGQVFAALEFGRRQCAPNNEVVITPQMVFELCADIRNSRKEHFVAFYLNSRGALIAREIISIGTLDASLVHPREVFEPALRLSAASIIVSHNHPSSDPSCSSDDIEVTRTLHRAGKLLGIDLLDHVIVTSTGWKSIIEEAYV